MTNVQIKLISDLSLESAVARTNMFLEESCRDIWVQSVEYAGVERSRFTFLVVYESQEEDDEATPQ